MAYTRPFVGSTTASHEKESRKDCPERLAVLEYVAASAHEETASATKARNEDFIVEETNVIGYSRPSIPGSSYTGSKISRNLNQTCTIWTQTHGIIIRPDKWSMIVASKTYDEHNVRSGERVFVIETAVVAGGRKYHQFPDQRIGTYDELGEDFHVLQTY